MASEDASEASSTSVPTTSSSVMAGVVLGGAALTMGLIAGVFYAYAVSVTLGLDRADDRTLVDGM
jgi:hypothetical protein